MPLLGRLGGLLLVVAILSGAGLYTELQDEVILAVDGEEHTVHTFGGSVAELLEARGVEVGPHDRVSPSLHTPLSDGLRVEVLLAKEVTLVLNGRARTIHVIGRTVDDVLEHVNLRSANRAYIRPSRDARIEDGDTIVLREAVKIRLALGKKAPREIITNAPTVAYLLDSMGVALRRHDRVKPGVDARLRQGLTIRVTEVRIREVTDRRSIPFETIRRETDDLYEGEERVQREGRAGEEVVTLRIRTENGEEVGRKLVDRTVVSEAVDEVVLVGTKARPEQGGGSDEAPPQGNVQEGIASWYDRPGMSAAHRTLPKGTYVHVTNLANGKSVTVVIDDRGPYVEGRIIDLSDEAYQQLAPLSSGTISVRITW